MSTPETDTSATTPATKPPKGQEVEIAAQIAKYGYVHRIVYSHGNDSPQEAAAWAKKWILKVGEPDRTFTFRHEGIPTLHRGDTLKLVLGAWSLTQTVWIVETTHSLSADDYTMDVTTKFEWPDEPDDSQITDDDIATVAETRGRVPATPPKSKPKPKPKGSSEHDDKPGTTLDTHPTQTGS